MSSSFLKVAHQGRNTWWRYWLAIPLILFFWFILGSIPYAAALMLQDFNLGNVQEYLLLNLSFWFFGLGLAIAVCWIHRRSLLSLISADKSVRWGRIAQGFAVWLALMVAAVAISYGMNPSQLEWTLNWGTWLRFLPLALIMTPIQTTVEELFFRGYLMQSLGLLTQHRWLVMLLSAILFAVPHFANPEMAANPGVLALYYLLFGLVAALFTLKDNRLELIIGIHAANNLLGALLVSYPDSVFNTPTLLRYTTFNPVSSLISFIILSGISYFWFFGRKKPMPLSMPEDSPGQV
ncbi:MAG: CPBP family intramembrane metalloprotease [Cyanobacteria bacterium Co-bin13]|nr:CPBP family intramembrane metalloprotease [Cyanobacteria bacterium Co-bin13]